VIGFACAWIGHERRKRGVTWVVMVDRRTRNDAGIGP
jgi:hypothetical protein